MNEDSYSKIEVVVNENSRSMESSDLIALPETSKTSSNPTPNPTPTVKNPEIDQIIKSSIPIIQDSSEQDFDDQQSNNGEMFGPKLRRNSSVPSAYALQLQAAVKRAFSMRRSSSVSESYCRIHDQSVTLAPPFDDEEWDAIGTRRSAEKTKKKKKNSKGKILKAWKKLFGL